MDLTRRTFLKRTLQTAAAAGVIYPIVGEPWQFAVENVTMPIRNLPEAFEGFRLVHLSDLHLHPFTTLWQIDRVIERVNTLQAELVVITGDFVTRGTAAIEPLMPALGRIQSRHGVISVLGNHDALAGAPRITSFLRKGGIEVLRNQGRELQLGGDSIFLAGVDSLVAGEPNCEMALQQRRTNQPTILLAHEPDFIDLVPRAAEIDVQLSGHSHGGQLCLPWIGPPVLPAWGQKYWRGLYLVRGTRVYTNRGIGSIGLPIRIGSIPEITVMTLVGDAPALEKSAA